MKFRRKRLSVNTRIYRLCLTFNIRHSPPALWEYSVYMHFTSWLQPPEYECMILNIVGIRFLMVRTALSTDILSEGNNLLFIHGTHFSNRGIDSVIVTCAKMMYVHIISSLSCMWYLQHMTIMNKANRPINLI